MYHVAPERYDHVILKIHFPMREQFENLRYEGFNPLLMKGAESGEEVARRWRELVVGSRGVFLLRDSLWSQQDHPYHRKPYALMMPPSWVTVAVAEVAAGRTPAPLVAPPLADDAAWAAVASPAAMFGSFPPSDTLYREAVRSTQGDEQSARYASAARASIRSLAADAQAMIAAAPRGTAAVAAAGAERIARSDRKYFGGALRYHRVIPLFVENPNAHELRDEGKGMTVYGRDIDPALVKVARDAVYRRRLLDGDLAVERYDLSQPAERDRAIEVLEALIGTSDPTPGGTLWLWVTGKLDPVRKAEGENAVRYLPAFMKQLDKAAVDRSRLRILSMPSTDVPADGQGAFLKQDAAWYRKRGLPYNVRLNTHQFHVLLQEGL
ncbi:MAG: hypothetical protein JNL21_11940 [Myxococcales bacterium]|nr:hypothetical protein [Myxococcales bacterium]